MNYKYLSKYHYIYRLSFGGDQKAHIEKIPIAYSNKRYIYVIEPGCDCLKQLTLTSATSYYRGDIFVEINDTVKENISRYLLSRYRDFTARYGVYSFASFWFLLDDPKPLEEMAIKFQNYDLKKLYWTTEKKRLEIALTSAERKVREATDELERAKLRLAELERKD